MAVKHGDESAFGVLSDRYRSSVLAYFLSRVGIKEQAEDLTQDVMVKVWRSCQRYIPVAPFDRYLFRAAENRWRDHLRALCRTVPTVAADTVPEALDATPTPEESILRRYRDARIRRAVASLPPHLHAVFVLSRLQGKRYREIAATLGIPEGTVKARMHDAVHRLRTQLKERMV